MKSVIQIKYKNVNNIKPIETDKMTLHFDESIKLESIKTKLTVKCKCGHSVFIPVYEDKVICTYCKNYVYNTTPMRFKHYFRKLEKSEKDV